MTTLLLAGSKATQIVSKIAEKLASMALWSMEKAAFAQTNLLVARTGFDSKQVVYEIYLPQEALSAIVKKLQELLPGSVTPSGQTLVAQLRSDAGLPQDGAEAWSATTTYSKFPGYFAKGKPFFVGMQALKNLYEQESKVQYVLEPYKGEPRYTCLAEEHKKLTKRALTPFAGWWMPILYTSILEEHRVVRETAALFDVTHMGVAEIAGKGAARFLDLLTPNDVEKLNIGQSQYSFLLTPDGDAIDDMTIYRRDKDKFMIVINASNAEKDMAWILAVATKRVVIDNEFPGREMDVIPIIRDLKAAEAGQDRKVDIALQGPRSLDIMRAAAGEDEKLKSKLASLGKWQFIEATLADMPMLICRSGYTGENWGFEAYLHPDDAAKFWNLLLAKGKPFGIQPTGLGARDSTRTEAGFPLYGHELAGELRITPLESGYPNFVRYDKPFFIGKKSLLAKDRESSNSIVRFEMQETGIRAVRPGAMVTTSQGLVIGVVTSCAYVGAKQIGMAYVDKKCTALGTKLGILNKSAQAKPIGELKPGDNLPISDVAIIVSRFAMRS
jgi:glycine hydroxymethyltransferase